MNFTKAYFLQTWNPSWTSKWLIYIKANRFHYLEFIQLNSCPIQEEEIIKLVHSPKSISWSCSSQLFPFMLKPLSRIQLDLFELKDFFIQGNPQGPFALQMLYMYQVLCSTTVQNPQNTKALQLKRRVCSWYFKY